MDINMNIIIVGAGKVGKELIERLGNENHNITVVDKNAALVDRLVEDFDIMGICGNGTICETLEEASIGRADILIATTNSDEINMICCVVAKKLGAKSCIARVRNVEYTKQNTFMREELDINLTVNPEYDAACEISKIVNFPEALKVDTFAKGKLEIAEFKINEGSALNEKALFELGKLFYGKVLVCAVQRGSEVYIPNGNFVLRSGDKISITAEHKELVKFIKGLGLQTQRIKNVMIVGGGMIAYHLANLLAETGIRVTIIEINREICDKLNSLLPKAEIICADGSDQSVLVEQGIKSADACVSLTGIDEENIIISLFAGVVGVDKVITKVNKVSLLNILDSIGLDTIISPKTITADIIMRYTRAKQNSEGSHIKTLYKIVDGNAEALEFIATNEFLGRNKTLKALELKKNLLIAGIWRRERFIIPSGEDEIISGDRVIVVTTEQNMKDLNEILA